MSVEDFLARRTRLAFLDAKAAAAAVPRVRAGERVLRCLLCIVLPAVPEITCCDALLVAGSSCSSAAGEQGRGH
jgi:hypothetical protein